jgi:hypothetical protein
VPFIRSQNITMGYSLAASLLAALSTRPGSALLLTPTVHLYTAKSALISPQSTVAQFTEAAFPGYAAVAQPTLLGPINLPSGEGIGVHSESDFLCSTSSTPGETILGYWVDNGGSTFYAAEQFANPIQILNQGDFVSLDLVYGVDNPVNVS